MRLDIKTIEEDTNYNIKGLMLNKDNPISYTLNTKFSEIRNLIDKITQIGNLSLKNVSNVLAKINTMSKMENMAIDETGLYTAKLYSNTSDLSISLNGSLILDNIDNDPDGKKAELFLHQYISLLYMNLYKMKSFGFENKEESDKAISEYLIDNHESFFGHQPNVLSNIFSIISTRFTNVVQGAIDSGSGLITGKEKTNFKRRPEKVKIKIYENYLNEDSYTLNCNTFDNKYFSTGKTEKIMGIDLNTRNINNMIFLINSCDISYGYDNYQTRVINNHKYYLPKRIDFTLNLVSERIYTLNELETLYFDKSNNLDNFKKYLNRQSHEN